MEATGPVGHDEVGGLVRGRGRAGVWAGARVRVRVGVRVEVGVRGRGRHRVRGATSTRVEVGVRGRGRHRVRGATGTSPGGSRPRGGEMAKGKAALSGWSASPSSADTRGAASACPRQGAHV